MDKYLQAASYFMSDTMITEGKAVYDEEAGDDDGKTDEFHAKGEKWPINLGTKGLPKKPTLKEEDEEDEEVNSDVLEEENDKDTEDEDIVTEDEDDGSEDGETDELTEDEDTETKDEDTETEDEDIKDKKKKKIDKEVNVVESYLAHASRWID